MNSRIFSRPVLIAATATLLTSAVGTYVWHEEHRPPLLEVFVFNLKSSQSIFIRTPDDKRILIDGGTNSEVVRHISRALPFYTRRIDSIIATDLSDKTIPGLIDVVERYHVSQVYIPGVTLVSEGLASSTGKSIEPFLDSLKKHSINLTELVADSEEEMDMGEFVEAQVLFPVHPSDFSYSKASSPKIVIKLVHGSNEILLAGDVTKKVQTFISSRLTPSDEAGDRALVVSTGGAATELSQELFNVFMPSTFLYSKAISYKLPSPTKASSKKSEVLSDVASPKEKINIREYGGAKIISDGKNIRVSPLKWN